jgi:hypothetical protein
MVGQQLVAHSFHFQAFLLPLLEIALLLVEVVVVVFLLKLIPPHLFLDLNHTLLAGLLHLQHLEPLL